MHINISLTILLLFATWAGVLAQSNFFDGASDPESQAVMKQAAIDIEKYRKGDFSFHMIDEKGKPIKNVSVEIELSNHLFDFGTSLFGVMALKEGDPLKKTAQETILDIFNMVVVVNYWHSPQDTQRFEMIRKDVAWAREKGLRTRFHAVLFTYPMQIFIGKDYSTDQCWEIIEERIKYVADATGGNLNEYDVINEVIARNEWEKDNPDAFMKTFPNFPDFSDPQVVKRIFDLARKYLPNTKLVGLETSVPSLNNPLYMETVDYWRRCLSAGADIDFVGTQAHFFNPGMEYQVGHARYGPGTFTMKSVNPGLDTLRSLGRPVVLTEFSGPTRISSHDPERREKFWTMSDEENSAWQINFYRLAFSKPYIVGLTRWYHVDNWCGRAMDGGILTKTGEKHQIYYDLRKLIKEEWHTRATLTTTKEGKAYFRGFYGDYVISVDGYQPVKIRFDKKSGEIVVKM